MWDQINKSATIVGIIAGVIAIIPFIEQSKTLPWVTDMLSLVLLQSILTPLILLLLAICLWRQNILKKQLEDHIGATAPALIKLTLKHSPLRKLMRTYSGKKQAAELYSLFPMKGPFPKRPPYFSTSEQCSRRGPLAL